MSADRPPDPPHSETVERVAKAIYQSAVTNAYEIVAAKTLPVEKIKTVFDDAMAASDREAAIIIFALIDDIVTEFFRGRLTGKVPDGVEQSFLAGNGMLASAYHKILLLAGLEWIPAKLYRELTLIRRIRNEFAHHVEYKSFGESPIRDFIGSMDASETPIHKIFRESSVPKALVDFPAVAKIADEILQEGPSIRTKFLIRSCLATAMMIRDTEIIQAAIANRVDPASVTAGGYGAQPDNMKQLLRNAAGLSFRALQNDLAPKIIERAGPAMELPTDLDTRFMDQVISG